MLNVSLLTKIDVMVKIRAYYKDCLMRECDVDLIKLKEYREQIEQMDLLSKSLWMIRDYCHDNYLYISDNIKRKLGVAPCSRSDILDVQGIHSDDIWILDSIKRARQFISTQPLQERKQYRLINEFRICNKSKQYVRVNVQHSILELDKQGNIWLVLRMMDYDPDQKSSKPAVSLLQHVESNEVIYKIYGDTGDDSISKREQEVLELISEGFVSKEIAEKLFISENTVNNHRKSILKKLNVNNASEAIKKAVKAGIIL